jgi:hypothetical protein
MSALVSAESSPDPLVPAPEGFEWLVCHTKPRCEKKLAALLVIERVTHYLPLTHSIRRYRHQTKRFTKPLFPGYVFTCIEFDRRPRLYQQQLLASVIAVDDEPRFLRQLHDVRAILASGYELAVLPLLTRGRRVKIVGTALHGLEGFVDDPANPQGVVLSVDVLRRGLLVKVPAENLHALP